MSEQVFIFSRGNFGFIRVWNVIKWSYSCYTRLELKFKFITYEITCKLYLKLTKTMKTYEKVNIFQKLNFNYFLILICLVFMIYI